MKKQKQIIDKETGFSAELEVYRLKLRVEHRIIYSTF